MGDDGVSSSVFRSSPVFREVASEAHASMTDAVDWGSVPAYFGGLALFLTLLVLLRDRSEKLRSQADQLAVWVIKSEDTRAPHQVVAKNASDLPCFDLAVWVTEGYQSSTKVRLSKTFGADTDRYRKPMYRHAVGPEETITVFQTLEDVAVRSIEFVDAAGRRWTRSGTQLKRTGGSRWDRARRRLADRRRQLERWRRRRASARSAEVTLPRS